MRGNTRTYFLSVLYASSDYKCKEPYSIEPLIMRYQRRRRRSKKLNSILMRPSQLHKQEMFITFFSEQNGEIQNTIFIRPGHRNMFILIGLENIYDDK